MLIEIILGAFTLALIALPVIWLRRVDRRAKNEQFIDAIEKYLQEH